MLHNHEWEKQQTLSLKGSRPKKAKADKKPTKKIRRRSKGLFQMFTTGKT